MNTSNTTTLGPSYTAAALQLPVKAVNRCPDRASARARINETIDNLAVRVRGTKHWAGPSLKLIVLPEYFLTSYPQQESVAEWADKAALDPDGPEYERMARIAQDNNVFLAGNAYETDKHFPGLYFQVCFIIDPAGKVVLRYRRLNSMFAPTPHDVWDKYLDLYGLEGVFPVARTEIGNLAGIASEEILYPEIARCFAMRGAEVFFHPTSENGSIVQTFKDVAKLARAIENMAYVVSANTGGLLDIDLPPDAGNGASRIIDFRGQVLKVAGWGETANAMAEIDLNALRRERRKPGMNNFLSRQRFDAFAASYAAAKFQTANALMNPDGTVKQPERAHFADAQARTLARLSELGLI
ncbi:MAG: nitrilase-related carbon-nitrogen hydrolase [Rhodospirillaceae bacterium]|nr:nitrilase-related carbon-nitrogen hydrolase [Rhodospirillaceae bacterium]